MKKVFSALFIHFTTLISAQTHTVAYSRDYEFKEGVYITASQFENNAPVPRLAIVSNVPQNRVDFIGEVMKQKDLIYIDSLGKEQRIGIDNVWGYSQNRIIYIYHNKKFVRMNTIGTFCQYTGSVTTTVSNPYPMYPAFGNSMYMGYPGYGGTSTFEELRQFIFNTKTNQVLEFNPQVMEQLLMDDEELYKEFTQLKRKKKSEMMFVYLRRYNEKHPLLLPAP
jgi:hypothetical protein